jgi:hypothetical protein
LGANILVLDVAGSVCLEEIALAAVVVTIFASVFNVFTPVFNVFASVLDVFALLAV